MRRPGNALMCAFIIATTSSSLFAHLWPFGGMEGLPGVYVLFCWIYCIVCFLIQDVCKVCLNLAMDALEFGAPVSGDEASQAQKDAHRLARVRLAKEKHMRRGTVSSPNLGPSAAGHTGGMAALGLGGSSMPIANTEDIRQRMDVLAAELERLRSALAVVGRTGTRGSSGSIGAPYPAGLSNRSSGGARTTNRSNLSSRSLSREFAHRSNREHSGSLPAMKRN